MKLKKNDKVPSSRIIHKVIGDMASIVGGLLVFLCAYWLFRLDTWTERGLYIGTSIFLALILIKILSFFNDE
ncbi:hypothetical protein DMO41_22600 [Salmonella enterica subsp. enterica serovar Muenster]|nr:hypothetical protein [Salmonella enterica subsp. enterica serovar Muenster]EAA9443628.1 hypothetical protein [Salmonella enterica subsp. enterica]EAB4824063.1 hypothetical protein [Salmonella enterica]EAB7442941.1 hypothetical protein [Salmonella enterica subsp. enterica serovar Anatum]EBC9964927.1 hypothetical protein [Salmonella enterica subsp. enterica serovar Kentucky]ECO6319347.1 hypothetical protein [Salmonella enterica subsp. enterica serovar Enteritidis]ECZ8775460.1 hypothetical pr